MFTLLYLLNGVYINHDNQIDFTDYTAQYNYFFNHRFSSNITEYQHVRQENIIKVNFNIDELYGVNYLMYKNRDKWFYCFIESKTYINPYNTALTIKIDVFQTYMFQYSFKETFIDREHQNRWIKNISTLPTPIYNVVPENLDTGTEYILNSTEQIMHQQMNILKGLDRVQIGWFLILASELLTEFGSGTSPLFTTPTPFNIYVVPFDINNPNQKFTTYSHSTTSGQHELANISTILNRYAKTSVVVSISFIPYLPLQVTTQIENDKVRLNFLGTQAVGSRLRTISGGLPTTSFTSDIMIYLNPSAISSASFQSFIKMVNIYDKIVRPNRQVFITGVNTSIDYESKMLTFPYQYLALQNYQSQDLILKHEYLPSLFFIHNVQNLGSSLKSRFYVQNYNNHFEGKGHTSINTTVNDIPLLTDLYLQYMMTNKASATTGVALNVGSSVLATGLTVGGAMLTASGVGAGVGVPMMIAGGMTAISSGKTIGNELIKQQDLKNTPDNIRAYGNNIDFDLIDRNVFLVLNQYNLTPFYRNVIWKYFMTYGYKANVIKIPDLKSRWYYNYIKTIGANIHGALDKETLEQLTFLYDRGFTIWHYRNEETFLFKDYSKENIEISMM